MMPSSVPPRPSAGFSAVELLFVIGILTLLTTIAAPTALKSLRRTATRQAASALVEAWNLARGRAFNEQPPLGAGSPRHFGVVIHQDAASAWIAVVFDKVAADPAVLAEDGDVAANQPGTGAPILKVVLPKSVVVVVGDGTPLEGDLVVYAQYRTGQPIGPADVAAGLGHLARPVAAGVAPALLMEGLPTRFAASAPTLSAMIRFQTLGFTDEPRRGEATQAAIFHAGVAEVFSP